MRIIADASWSREDAQSYLFARAKRPVEGMRNVGKYRDSEYDKQHESTREVQGQLSRAGAAPQRPCSRS
jgi:hypothetical protein